MTWAQLGLRHPLSGVEEGWAWVNIDGVGEGRDGVAAHAMSDFVARTLVQLEAEAGVERAADETTTQDSRPLDGANRTLPSVIKQNPQLGDVPCPCSCYLLPVNRFWPWSATIFVVVIL